MNFEYEMQILTRLNANTVIAFRLFLRLYMEYIFVIIQTWRAEEMIRRDFTKWIAYRYIYNLFGS